MLYTILDDLIFYQTLTFIKKYSNFELKLIDYFYNKTNIYPKNVILINQFVFYFVSNEHYFQAKKYLNSLRHKICRKLALIREEKTLINLILSFFPDIYIHDITVEYNIYSRKWEISVKFLTLKERGIAMGRNGDYIKAVNKIFEKNIIFQNNGISVKINCKLTKLNH